MKTFENNDYSVEAKEESGCRLSLKIEIRPQSAKKAYKRAVKEINKQISIPGFRKGHAPDSSVINKYSSYIEKEWKEILVQDAYRAALDLTKIYPLNKESISHPKIESCTQEEGAVVSLSYECYPTVPEIDFSKITLPKSEPRSIADEQIEEIVGEVKRSHADWEQITDREVQLGDYINLTVDNIDLDPPATIVKERRFEATEEQMAPWILKLVIGMKVSESIEGLSEVDEKADEAVKQKFQPTRVRITLNSIEKILLPELTDELAKKVGADSVEDLRNKIRLNLEREAKESHRQAQIEALDQALLDYYHFDLPQSLVESERVERIRRRLEEMKKQGRSDDEIKSRERIIEEEVREEIDEALRLYFINKQILRQGKLTVTNEEVNRGLIQALSQNPYRLGKDATPEASKQFLNEVSSSLLQQKVKEYALEQTLQN